MTDSTRSDTERVLEDYVAVWNGDLTKLDVVSDDATIYDSVLPGGEVVGHDAIVEYFHGFHERYPDVEFTLGDRLIDEGVAMYEWTATGLGEGETNGISKTVIADGTVTEDWIYHE